MVHDTGTMEYRDKMARSPDTQDRKKSKKISNLAALWPFIQPYKPLLIGAFAALVVTAFISLLLPMAVRRVVDNFNSDVVGLLNQYFVAAIGFAGLLAFGTALRYALVTRLGERVVTDMRKAVFDRVLSMSPAFYENIMTGEVISRLTTDTTLIQSVIGSSVSIALRNFLIFIGGMVLMLLTSVKLTLLVLLIVPAVVVPILVLGRRLRVLGRENQEKIAISAGLASESLGAVQTVQAFTNEGPVKDSFNAASELSFYSALSRIRTRSVMTALVIFLVFSGVIGVLWIGANDVRTGAMSVGVLVQFLIYSIMVAGAVAALSEIWGELQRAAGATERLIELLHAKDPVQDLPNPVPMPQVVQGHIRFDNVAFSYPSRPDQNALDHVSFEAKAGETVALVGPSGAGKSSVIQLLLRFYDAKSGVVSIDGLNIADLSRDAFRQSIALVPQEPVIFAVSAWDNIRRGRPDASDEDVIAAAKAAHAHEFLEKLPQGYDTFLGERGIMLSGGQKQRIAIARAILRDAPVLLLDEATSALDAESEALVQKAVDQLSQNRTSIVVAHRLATVKKADRILVMEDGRIVDQGTHEELVAKEGLYSRLAKMQFTDGA